jgi:hypothetical protein
MYTLLFAAGQHTDLGALLEGACRVTAKIMPRLGSKVSWAKRYAGPFEYWYALPDPCRPSPLITEHRHQDRAVLAFGELFGPPPLITPAQRILSVWEEEGVEGVRRLDGSFSAILMNLCSNSVDLACDIFGRRPLKYLTSGDTLLVSPHDVPLVATGLCPLDYDLHSAASVIACDWSLGGRPLLRPLRMCTSEEKVHWEPGELRVSYSPPITFSDRLTPGETDEQAQLVEEMIEAFREHIRRLCEGDRQVRVELTAGLDTRVVLAAAMSAVDHDKIITQTGGAHNDFESSMARRIARSHGLPHEMWPWGSFSLDDFLENARMFAFYMNGESNSRRGTCPPMRYDAGAPVTLGGGGGELYRGCYYPRPRMQIIHRMSVQDATDYMHEHLSWAHTLPWSDQSLESGIWSRLHEILNRYAELTHDGHDLLDLFFLYERFGKWALGARLPVEERRYFPYECAALLRRAFRLTAPIFYHCPFHELILHRHLPKAYWWPLNQRRILPLELQPCVDRLPPHRRAMWVLIKRLRPLLAARYAAPPVKGLENLQMDLFGDMLRHGARDLLTQADGFGAQLFGPANLDRLIDAYMSGDYTYPDPLGALLTLEEWRLQVTAASRMAEEVGTSGVAIPVLSGDGHSGHKPAKRVRS